jgi:hypothetical protein
MKRLGQLLAAIGLVLGVLLGVGLLVPLHVNGLVWLAAVGGFKLVLASSLGLIAGGAALQRVARERDAEVALPPGPDT